MSEVTTKKSKATVDDVVRAYETGSSDVEVAALLNVTMGEFEEIYKTNESFQRLVDLGRLKSKAWWYSQARINIKNKLFNAQVYNFYMKNRYGWADKTENYNQADIPLENLSQDELKSRILKFQEAWAKQNKLESGAPDHKALLGVDSTNERLAKTKRN